MDWLSVPQAAAILGVGDSRVRAMLAAGQLEGQRIGGRWVVSSASAARRKRQGGHRGRPLLPENAWGVLVLASGDGNHPLWPRDARARDLLEHHGLRGLRPRLGGRAHAHRYRAHRGVLGPLGREPLLAPAGAGAARRAGLDLVAGDELDAYVSENAIARLVEEFGLDAVGESDPSGNVVLRGVPEVVSESLLISEVPVAAVALDLVEQADRRSQRIGADEVSRLDRERRWQAWSRVPALG